MSSSLERAAAQSLRCFSWKAVVRSSRAAAWVPRRKAQELRCSKAGVVEEVLAVWKLKVVEKAEDVPELTIET